tara:strand:+ start:70 stop:405 length:336 start_codon:yes stop_codon:yes gene_type:complete
MSRTVYIRDADWNALYQDLLTKSFNAGYKELHNFLTKWCSGPQPHGDGTIGWHLDTFKLTQAETNAMLKDIDNYKPIISEAERKTILKQGRSLGVQFKNNSLSNLNLKEYA